MNTRHQDDMEIKKRAHNKIGTFKKKKANRLNIETSDLVTGRKVEFISKQ